VWLEVGGTPLLAYTLSLAAEYARFERIVVVTPQAQWDEVRALGEKCGVEVTLVEGGTRRQESVRHGLELCGDLDYVCVHDAARPLCTTALVDAVIQAAEAHRAATAAVPVTDTVKRVAGHEVVETLRRDELWNTQTPQAFETALLQQAHADAAARGVEADDDAMLVEMSGVTVHVVEGDAFNFKVTRPADLTFMKAVLQERASVGAEA
jgi:2-C-methyl-D-erythritol 4-phosphate cytidylyltransferase